ncbi:Aste57867_20435 [Aphanomyces stellatus]|uniref:Aste57867_20435 protein n=1 Tax=Aphanomyces stellatus TaxID=120398 RepID=A0A485LF38_9STRA|nr:hypothetical protein As57867_020369 [Aphanomyces stellatus]VFT97121.1 Aste57867_20435 [Aphanomyces stellatus]
MAALNEGTNSNPCYICRKASPPVPRQGGPWLWPCQCGVCIHESCTDEWRRRANFEHGPATCPMCQRHLTKTTVDRAVDFGVKFVVQVALACLFSFVSQRPSDLMEASAADNIRAASVVVLSTARLLAILHALGMVFDWLYWLYRLWMTKATRDPQQKGKPTTN